MNETSTNWQTILNTQGSGMSEEERTIVSLLAQGATQPEIGRRLGLHRSAVWRRIKALRKRLQIEGSTAAGSF